MDDEKERQMILAQLGKFAEEGNVRSPEDEKEAPEDCIPDLPENQKAREFLKKAPSKGLYMPLGKEVKVMQCWRCKAYGHRTGDADCPLRDTGNVKLDAQRQAREDPMSKFVAKRVMEKEEKYERVAQLRALVEEIREEERERKRLKKMTKKEKRKVK
jgi:retinitis pigmentosa 9 protein